MACEANSSTQNFESENLPVQKDLLLEGLQSMRLPYLVGHHVLHDVFFFNRPGIAGALLTAS